MNLRGYLRTCTFAHIFTVVLMLMLVTGNAAFAVTKTEEPIDWTVRAAAELQPAATTKRQSNGTGLAVSGVLPTPATIRAEVEPIDSVIERTALRFGFLFEPYQPRGVAKYGVDERANYSNLSGSVLGQVDLRWLPFEPGMIFGRATSLGGYIAFGYSRHKMPLKSPTGFRYDDVAVNSLRSEAGLAMGAYLNKKLNFELRAGAGRMSMIQTSQYSDVVASLQQPYAVASADLSYHVKPRFAVVASVSHRRAIGGTTGAITFDPVTVSGGFLVQVR